MNAEVEQMAEEVNEELETSVETVSEDAVEYSDVEQEAMAQGWNPEGVEGKRSLSAEEFLDRKPLYDKMHKLEKRLKDQDRKFDAMQQHEKMVRDRMHQDHLKELEEAKRKAYEEMDFDKADKITNDIIDAKVEHSKEQQVTVAQTQEQIQATLTEWTEKNSWYNSDPVLQKEAEKEGKLYRFENPGAPFEDLLEHVAKEVKSKFPEKFRNSKREQPSSVEGSATGATRTPKAPKKKSVKDLPEEAISVMKTLVRTGAFKSEQDYVESYFNS